MKALEQFMRAAQTTWSYALDTLAPPDPDVRRAELLGVQGFAALAHRTDVHDVISYFPYKTQIVRASFVEIKDYLNRKIISVVAGAAYFHLAREDAVKNRRDAELLPLLVPVPMTRKDIRKRGWNQCELVAAEMARLDGGRLFEFRIDVLKKIRQTGDQVGKNREERLDNLGNSMVADAASVRGRTVIVLDDIVTTGATLTEARRALTDAGAVDVICIALAH